MTDTNSQDDMPSRATIRGIISFHKRWSDRFVTVISSLLMLSIPALAAFVIKSETDRSELRKEIEWLKVEQATLRSEMSSKVSTDLIQERISNIRSMLEANNLAVVEVKSDLRELRAEMVGRK